MMMYAAVTDHNNHASVMGMDSATSQQQMQLFDGSTITPSPLGLLNPDFDPTTQSWFGFSPAPPVATLKSVVSSNVVRAPTF